LWKENFSETTYSDSGLVSILANYPKLLQRPIVIKIIKPSSQENRKIRKISIK
jgi:arsenate reductase-like glutaredoxin family protein